ILDPLINKIKSENFEKIIIPRKYQNPLAKIFPNLRTRLGTKILIDKDSCKGCRKCITLCPAGAITDDYKVTKKCIRCLRCVETCKFITYQKNFFLKLYLKLFFKQRKSYIYY
ncbi:MAG TPA: 4Fe-4S binding protein, partial [Acholeplasmataceae bacterium]|nr:4Fe-4S binding protein [Acholeplasmataceae bacterium]